MLYFLCALVVCRVGYGIYHAIVSSFQPRFLVQCVMEKAESDPK